MGIIQFVRDAIASDTRERLAFCAVILISITPALGVAALAKVVQEGNFFELDFDFDFFWTFFLEKDKVKIEK